MPELAEVEFYRKQWDAGVGKKVLSVHLNEKKRVFRGTDTTQLRERLVGATLVDSKTHGKQMLFRFTRNAWLGIHLGMTGQLSIEKRGHENQQKVLSPHDHLVLFQKGQALIFNDPRQFG